MSKPIPMTVQIGWQVYRRIGFRDHWLRNGDYIELVEAEALCAACGTPFTSSATKSDWRSRHLTRRCKRHRARGLPVDSLKPPVPTAMFPARFKPDRKKIKATAERRRYAKPAKGAKSTLKKVRLKAGAKRLQRPTACVEAVGRPVASGTPPLPSYLD